MKKITLLLASIVSFGISLSQEIKFGPGIDMATPISEDLTNSAGAGFGASFRGQIGFIDKFSVMGTVGFQKFGEKNDVDVSMIPVQFGFKYALMDAEIAKFYFSAEAGIHSVTSKVGDNKNTASIFSYAPGFGVQISKIDLSTRLQFMGKHEDLANAGNNYFSIRLGYMFGL